ncbi:MAG TPA: ABC transporter ATP-binding protein/permease [Clostridia bacterium]|jgi:ATP-binding cassette subfamily C protein|nr:ABC transporter ATP-binding protein/permease [Clostridia bacterium]
MLDKGLFELLGKEKKYVGYITIIDLIGMLANVAVTACICLSIGLAIKRSDEVLRYVTYIGIALISGIIKAITIWASGKLKNTLGSNVKRRVRSDAYNKLLDLGLSKGGQQTAALTQMMVEGVEQLDSYYSYYLPSFFNAMIAPIILFVICVSFRWQVGLVLILALPIIPISIILVSKWARRVFSKYWDKYTSMGNSFFDNLQGMKELKIFAADLAKQQESAVKSEEFRVITMKVLVMQLASLTIIDTVAFGAAAISIVFSILGALDTVNPLSPAVALFLILISAEFFIPMRTLASAFHVAMNGSAAGKKLKVFLDMQVPKWGNTSTHNPESIEVQDVSFSYDDERFVLKNVDMKFKPGFNAIVGESGSGKSTIVSLLLGAHVPQFGKVTLDSVLVRDYDRSLYYKKITCLGYDTYIFNESIRENFRLAKEDITDEEIYSVLEKVNLKDFIKNIGGLDYVILEDSENISGGERQRLALAINLVVDKDIYIFDEATSNIDVESEAIIMNLIKKLAKTKIVIVISHRLANVREANIIYMLEDGLLIEQGTHQELMDQKGKYQILHDEQYDLEHGYMEVSINA